MQQALEKKIIQLADQCVKCGMCLPSCPTYQISKNENESPRGRIALMQGVVQGELTLSPKIKNHLDHCVSCLSCEKICPSTVKYETLIDSIREYTVSKQQYTVTAKLISFFITPVFQKRLFTLLRIYQLSGLQTIVRNIGLLKVIGLHTQEKLLPKLSPYLKLKEYYPATSTSIGSVALFTGCMGNLFEQKAILASIKVLNTLGYNVDVPSQVCCGALHQHSGYSEQAEILAVKNRKSFLNDNRYAAIIFTASGCGAQLKSTLEQSKIPITSVIQFIYNHAQSSSLRFMAIETKHIAVHQPCSLKNSLGEDSAVIHLLNKIPSLTVTELSSQCCGAAGKNMLTHANLANQIRQPLLEQITAISPNIVLSSNIGCALHLMAGLSDEHKKEITLIHPVELLAQSLIFKE